MSHAFKEGDEVMWEASTREYWRATVVRRLPWGGHNIMYAVKCEATCGISIAFEFELELYEKREEAKCQEVA